MAERTTPGTMVALTIAGSDCSGGAGIQADLKTFTVLDVYGAAVITAITAQNTRGVRQVQMLSPEIIEQQIDAVAGDIEIRAAKTGMLGNAANIEIVAKAIKRHNLFPLVVDPVMVSKSGDSLIDDAAVSALCKRLLPLAAVVTPNLHEAARLLGQSQPIADPNAAAQAARSICSQFGARACIVTGIHRGTDQEGQAVDYFFDGHEIHELVSDWRTTANLHGSGCTFSAAIAAALAAGSPLEEAAQIAKSVVSEAIRQSTDLGGGTHRPVNHLAYAKVKK